MPPQAKEREFLAATTSHVWTEYDEYSGKPACECGAILGAMDGYNREDRECSNNYAMYE